ncbi:hypothetical protein [Mycolicibacterium wolinskyi]|uniref:hypothetical protein n=1 Tax=Mycolicibacterium wolinskyi TaxID=59750 RepID=UPI0039179B3C
MEHSPNRDRRLTDDELIAQSLDFFEDVEAVIDDATSRMIASQFHSGQASDLYSFASTGSISDDLLSEINRTYEEFKDQPPEQRKLAHLALYIADRRSRGDVAADPDWSGLWLQDRGDLDLCPCCHEHISRNHRVGCPLGIDASEQLERVQELQTEHGDGLLMWLDYVGFRNLDELNTAAARFEEHYHGKWPSLRDYAEYIASELDNPPSIEELEAELAQQVHLGEALDGSVHIFDR